MSRFKKIKCQYLHLVKKETRADAKFISCLNFTFSFQFMLAFSL